MKNITSPWKNKIFFILLKISANIAGELTTRRYKSNIKMYYYRWLNSFYRNIKRK
jgi:hypothetical protein